VTDPSLQESAAAFARLLHIVRTLRGEQGCPWDIKQTPLSLKKYLLEECQELIEAIDHGSHQDICEEIGDVLFILTMLTHLYTEQQRFTATDVFSAINDKMIRRHPHVFGDAQVTDEQELRAQWLRIKEQEKQSSKPAPS
jgi:tetrapyrrole methylase family protein/MazG family protein/ATP diphosphatase